MGPFDEKGKNDGFVFVPTKNKGFALQTPEIDKSYQNGGCPSGKGMIYHQTGAWYV